jgi:hypothetical protein
MEILGKKQESPFSADSDKLSGEINSQLVRKEMIRV